MRNPTCKLIQASDFGKLDPYFRNGNQAEKCPEDRLRNLRSRVESIRVSRYLHPEVEEYVFRVLNTFLHGWFYYPLFKVAEILSRLNLELALRCRYEFQTGQRTSLGKLLRRASRSGSLRFEETEVVKIIHQQSAEFESLGFQDIKKRDINEIARNREKVVTENLPNLRAYDVHPTMASVTMPYNALTGIRHNIDYMNIIAENSDAQVRTLFSKMGFNWTNATFVPVVSNEEEIFPRSISFTNRKSIALSEVELLIEEVSRFLGLTKRNPADQLWILNKFTLLPTKPYESLLKVLNRREELRPNDFAKKEDLDGIEWIESNCCELLKKLNPQFKLRSDRSEVLFKLIRFGKTKKKWKVAALNEASNSICFVKSNDLSYYLLLKLSIWAHQTKSITGHLRLLKKIIGGISS